MTQVSIILPVYNGELYLREALNSIQSQTFTDFECIIVNDGSTDNSLAIAKEYAQKDTRFTIITHEKNYNLPFSLNVGHKAATSPLLTWTSDDNILLPTFLETHLPHFTDENVDLTYAPYLLIDENGNPLELKGNKLPPYFPISHTIFEEKNYLLYETLMPEFMVHDNCIGASFMYRKEVFEKVNGYDVTTFLYEDYFFWIKAYQSGAKFKQLSDIVYKYRSHPHALSMRAFPEHYYNFRYSIRKLIPTQDTDLAFETRMTLHRDICPHLPYHKHLRILWEAFSINPLKCMQLIAKKNYYKR